MKKVVRKFGGIKIIHYIGRTNLNDMRQLKINKQITGRGSYAIEKYLQEIGRFHVLEPEEEAELAKRIRSGDEESKEKLVMCYLGFVVSVAKQYQSSGLPLDDLINEGNLGLIKAAECFDETKGFKFISYAVWWIRQSILQAVSDHARLIRLPMNRITAINKLNRCYSRLEQQFQRPPTDEEIADQMNVTLKEVKENMKIAPKPLSWDAPIGNDEDSLSLSDVYIVPEDAANPANALERESLRKDLKRAFTILSEQEARILTMFYGLEDSQPMTLEEISRALGMTTERIRQVKAKAIQKLKGLKDTSWLKSYLS